MSGFPPNLTILPVAQRLLWPQLAPASSLGFALYGGTAIALRLGHRESVDFDFFSDRPLDRKALHQAFPFLANATVIDNAPDTLTILARPADSAEVKVSFFGGLGFGRVAFSERTADGVLQVASMLDLMATKLKVMLERAEAKDYRDIAALIEAGVSLPRGLAAARLLFAPTFHPQVALKAMTYFQDGDLHTLPAKDVRTLVNATAGVDHLPTITLLSRNLAEG